MSSKGPQGSANQDPNHNANQSGRTDHPDLRAHSPGRIPESLIDAAIDGELDQDLQREIARALNYDPNRRRELLDTAEAINALQMPLATPDFTDMVLDRADRQRRFIPASWRRHIRAGRLGMAAGVLLTLMGVAALQHAYPRLTTLAAHPTPVQDMAQAVEQDREQLARVVSREVRSIRATVAPVQELLPPPGRSDFRFGVGVQTASASAVAGPGQHRGGVDSQSRFSVVRAHPGLAAVFISSDTGHALATTQRPVRVLGASFTTELSAASWVGGQSSLVRFVSRSRTAPEHAAEELDVPDLP